MICLITTTLIQNFTYMHFGIILTQFYINFSRQENQIELCNRSQSTPEIFRFKPIPPFKCIFVCVYDWWDEFRTETQDIFNSWLMYLYIYLVTGGKETGLKPRIAYPVPGLYIYIYVLVTGGKDTGLKPRIAYPVPGLYIYIYVLVTGGKDTGLKPRIAYLVPGLYIYIYVLVTGGKDTGLKPRIADLVPGSWAQRSNVLCAGDIMLNLNGKECSNMMQHQIGK